jgi:hypothetical protein
VLIVRVLKHKIAQTRKLQPKSTDRVPPKSEM